MDIKEKVEVFTDLETAVAREAEQNWNRDRRLGLVRAREKQDLYGDYVEEARHLLNTTGQGYDPEDQKMVLVKYEK